MSLKIRRGLEADLPASPDDGELLYATDSNKLFIGFDGTANEISGGTGSGITAVVQDSAPVLGGNLDLGAYGIISTAGRDLFLTAANGTRDIYCAGTITRQGNLTIAPKSTNNVTAPAAVTIGSPLTGHDGNLVIERDTFSNVAGAGLQFVQRHDTASIVPFLFSRARGNSTTPTAVQNGDRLGAVAFNGFDGTGGILASSIAAAVEGSVATNSVPTKITFATHNGTAIAIRAEISAAGILKTNSIQPLSGSVLSVTSGNLQLNAQGDLRFADADSSNYVGFQAPATVSSNITWTLPGTDGTTGQVLTTDGSGALSWTNAASAGTLASRVSINGNTGSIANGATGNFAISGFKSYLLMKISVTHAAWVRLYTDEASRTADASRLEGTDPSPSAGVIAEVITTGSQTILISPGVFGFNNETIPTGAIPMAVTNKSGASATITVTLTVLQVEV
jgi:surface antigen